MQTHTAAHQTTPSAYTPDHPSLNEDQHDLRVLIDEVATTRGLALQMSLRLMTYHAAPNSQASARARAEFLAIADQFARNITLVFGKGPFGEAVQCHVDMIRAAAGQDSERSSAMQAVLSQVQQVARDLTAEKPLSFAQAAAFLEQNWPVVRDQMTQVIADVWANIDAARESDLGQAQKSANALGTRLTRLEHIGKHVRLVSLNASVEAARAGDVGKGLMVIAHEFKSLAEEIQSLARDARGDMDLFS